MGIILCISPEPSDFEELQLSYPLEKGQSFIVCEGFFESLEVIASQKVDAIICREQIDAFSVLDLVKLIKSAELKEIVLIGFSYSGANIEKLLDSGISDFILAPLDSTILKARIKASTSRLEHGGVEGSFDHLSILDLLQMLNSSGKSGVLNVRCLEISGVLCLQDGHIFHAHAGRVKGEEAVFELVRFAISGGDFSFKREIRDSLSVNVNKRTDHLLLSLATQLDEVKIKSSKL